MNQFEFRKGKINFFACDRDAVVFPSGTILPNMIREFESLIDRPNVLKWT